MNPSTSVTKIGQKSLNWFLDMVFKDFRDGQMNRPECSMPLAPFFNTGRGIKSPVVCFGSIVKNPLTDTCTRCLKLPKLTETAVNNDPNS